MSDWGCDPDCIVIDVVDCKMYMADGYMLLLQLARLVAVTDGTRHCGE